MISNNSALRSSRAAFIAAILTLAACLSAQELHIPGLTAYLDPDTHAAHVGTDGVIGWSTSDTLLWGGRLATGELKAAIMVRLPKGESSKIKMTIAGKSKEVAVEGTSEFASVDFGSFDVASPGYQRIELLGVSKSGKTFGDIQELVLSGPAAKDALFNMKERRNASSVHLGYPLPKGAEVAWFYNEVTPKTDPTASYYEACGFARGYFGIQVNSKTERRVIFSVWDYASDGKSRSQVAKEDQVSLVAKGDGVEASVFGGEGTGGHSHLKYMWKTGETQKFLLTAKADGDATIYSGYFFFSEQNKWGLIASFRAPHDGKLLHGLYSFNEDFDGSNGHLQRLCEFGNQWVKTTDGKWIELTTAHFTHDPTGNADRNDYGSGVTKDGRFYLSNGGFTNDTTPKGPFTRPATGKEPAIPLPVP